MIIRIMIKKIFIIFIFFLSRSLPAFAQQTIFNVPNADVTPKGNFYTENEGQFKTWNSGQIYILTEYNNFGMGHNTDLEASVYNVQTRNNSPTMGYGFKSYMPILNKKYPEREYKLTIGDQVLVSYSGTLKGTGNWSYTHLSGRVPIINARLTGGVYAGTKQYFGRGAVGFLGGYEIPVTKRLKIIGDWYSGGNAQGFFIPGFSYTFYLPDNPNLYFVGPSTLYVGYRIHNDKRSGSSGIVIEINTFISVIPMRNK